MKKDDSILKEVLEKVKPPEEKTKEMENSLKEFIEKIEKKVQKQGIKAEVFVGGSFAKNTMIKKDKYDVDVFLRFEKTPIVEDISKISEKILEGIKKWASRVTE